MAPFVELIPILAFFICYQLTDLYKATIMMMAISCLQVIVSLAKKEPIPTERWLNFITLMILGSIALISRNSYIIKLKPTIGYLMGAVTFKLTFYRESITIPEKAFGEILHLPKKSWEKASDAWIVFLCTLAALNLIVAYTTPTSTWVYFKLLGVVLMVLFTMAQMMYFSYFKKTTKKNEFIPR